VPHNDFEGMRRAVRIGYNVSISEVRELLEEYDKSKQENLELKERIRNIHISEIDNDTE